MGNPIRGLEIQKNFNQFLVEVIFDWKEIWSIHLETSLVGLPLGFGFYWQTVPDIAGSMADELILGILILYA